jgi:biopolymer transport protein ExbD
MDFRRKKRQPVDIGLIPMIDVLLVLLFFFMVATTFRHHSDLKINLPEADGSHADVQSKAINLYIDAKGVYSLVDADDKPQTLSNQDLESLKIALSQLSPQTRQLPFIISADSNTPHHAVISALDIANQVGFHQITFAINPLEK